MTYQLTRLRKEAGYKSRKEFAERAGISEYTYKNWETKPGTIPLDKACDICDILGCTLDELAGREVVRRTNDIQENALLRKWRNMDASQKSMVMASVNAAQPKKREDHPRGLSEGIA